MKYILVADDEEINRDLIVNILEDDYELSCVTDGIECLKSIEERLPDLLLLDVGMPNMDGIEVCKRLRAMEQTKNLPIYLVSGYAAQDNIEDGLNVGADKYITKPFTPRELLDLLRNFFSS